MANRHRRAEHYEVGDEVLYRDPRQRKAGGRTPYKQPYSDGARVVRLNGNKLTLRKADGSIVKDIHREDCLRVPHNSQNLEKAPLLIADDPESLEFETIDAKRSPGMMLEDGGESVRRLADAQTPLEGTRKRHKVVPGCFVAYRVEGGLPKVVGVGKVTAVSKLESKVVLHQYKPLSDGMLRLH